MFIKKFLNNESVSIVNDVSKDFIYVTDVADVIITSILKNKNGIFNIGSGEKITINKISNIISKLTKSKNETQIIEKQGEYNSFIKINKAQNELNFLPKITLEQGLKKEIEWHTKYNDYGHFGKFGE
jgi:UDP-glucose 4-epimerase